MVSLCNNTTFSKFILHIVIVHQNQKYGCGGDGIDYIKFTHVVALYGTVMGLNDVSISIGEGITGLVGPNGAGKTTFMKLCMGLIKPTFGSVEIMGENPWNNPNVMKKLGYCPEYDMLYPDMNGKDALMYHIILHGFEKNKAEKKAVEYLRMIGLESVMHRKIRGYSTGMKQRLKVAMAIAHEPNLLLLDEPLSGTDPIGKASILEKISEWVKDGRSVIISSHMLRDVEKITDNIVLIHKGRIVARGNIHEIRKLIDKYPQRIFIKTNEPRRLAKILVDYQFVEGVSVYSEDSIFAYTRKPDEFYRNISGILYNNKIRITHMSSPDDNLNAIFTYLVG